MLEVSIDSTLNATLEVTRGGLTLIVSPTPLRPGQVYELCIPLRYTRWEEGNYHDNSNFISYYCLLHCLLVVCLLSGLELFVDDNSAVTLSGAFNLVLPIELSANQNLFVGGNENPDYSFVGCLKEVALYDR